MTDYQMTREQWDNLVQSAKAGHLGEENAFACNASEEDHLHFRRVGEEGAGLGSRVAVMTHDEDGMSVIYLAAPEARQVAARLLNIADEIDGSTRLNFVPVTPEEIREAASGAPLIGEPETPSVVGLFADLARNLVRRFR